MTKRQIGQSFPEENELAALREALEVVSPCPERDLATLELFLHGVPHGELCSVHLVRRATGREGTLEGEVCVARPTTAAQQGEMLCLTGSAGLAAERLVRAREAIEGPLAPPHALFAASGSFAPAPTASYRRMLA